MAKNVCLNCGYFLNCKLASEHLTYCEKFVKANRTITRLENTNVFDEKYKRFIMGIFDEDDKFEMKVGGRHGRGIKCIKVKQYVYEELKKQCQKKVLVNNEVMPLHSYFGIPIKVDDSIEKEFEFEYYK